MRHPALWLALSGVACGTAGAIDVGGWGGPDLRVDHALWLEAGGQSFLGRGVVQRRGDRLDLLLLAPTGQRLLTVQAQGRQVRSRAAVPALERLDPARLLDDVRWAFFDGCPAGLKGPEVQCQVDGHRVTEVRDDQGHPVRREVHRRGSTVRIAFEGWSQETGCPGVPPRVRFQDLRWGYRWEMGVDQCRRPEVPGP
ncbi:MAG TPA: DUF3261 domain-containing protein [Myxococcota bacterium]|nr:DUF3261 domain-containing protein [Myxococcota bacterium]HQK50846.1 DUF3261 domain-containing protein [Myxococcota bacterium]